MAVNLPTEGDRKSVGGVEYIYYGETGWVRVPQGRNGNRSRGYDDGPKDQPANPMLQGDPEVDPTWKPTPAEPIDIRQDPELQGFNLPATIPSASVENPNDNLADPVAGPGPQSNPVGSDADPDTPGMQGPGAVRVNSNGVQQQGRDLSLRLPTLEEIQAYTGRKLENPFASNDLPGTNDFSSDDAAVMGVSPAEADTIANGGFVTTDISPDGTSSTSMTQGSPIVSTDSPQNPNGSPTSEFLNADSSMAGLKAKEAAQGLVYASGKYWVKNPKAGQAGEPELVEVRGSSAGGENRQAVRDYKAGNIDPQTFFDNYVRDLNDSELNPDSPSDQEIDPDTSTDETDTSADEIEVPTVDDEEEETQV